MPLKLSLVIRLNILAAILASPPDSSPPQLLKEDLEGYFS